MGRAMEPVHVRLRPNHERRVAAGHPWVFSNEIEGDVAALPKGGTVDVFDAKGKFLGRGYSNPASLIAVRILSRARREDIDAPAFFAQRLRDALSYRAAVYPNRRSYRLVHAEADLLPGLVIDRYEDVLAVQITTLGIEERKEALREAITEVLAPKGVVMRAEGKMRALEGLEDARGVWWGDVPERLEIEELDGLKFIIDPLGSQKTGHFFDQAENRSFAARISRGRTVLDLFANAGGFGLYAAVAGASRVTCVDVSEENCVRAMENAQLNGVAARFEAGVGEAKHLLEKMVGEGRRYGVVMIDPPAFAKSRKTASAALKGYRDVNAMATMLVQPDGFLVTSSCSYHIEEERFFEAVSSGATKAGRRLRLVHRGEQAADHPVLPEVPETRYLKHAVFQVRL